MSQTTNFLLCCDLDGTLLPNGTGPESVGARSLFNAIASRPELTLAYASGRNIDLLKLAILEYKIPSPRYAIGDVGTTIYEIEGGQWQLLSSWHTEMAADWNGRTCFDVAKLLDGLDGFDALRLQELERQNTFKLSYYAPLDLERDTLFKRIRQRLVSESVKAILVWSVDEKAGVGLVDILPEGATKLHALRFVMARLRVTEQQVVFAGDSGNDVMVLASSMPSVLVRNAREDVRTEALDLARAEHCEERLYCAQGDFHGLNGNYAAGVLEGLAHFRPETETWIKESTSRP